MSISGHYPPSSGGAFDWESADGHERIREITNAVRLADREFEKEGGSSRHWVRDHFIPQLEERGLTIVPKAGA